MQIPKSRAVRDAVRTASVLVVGGWHHGRIGPSELRTFLDHVTKLRAGAPTIVTEAMPTHWPGGSYRSDGNYPDAVDGGGGVMCERNLRPKGDSREKQRIAINVAVIAEARRRARRGVRALRIARPYEARGDAHVGFESRLQDAGDNSARTRDCVHWCAAPGVLDLLARATLSEASAALQKG